MWSLYRIKEFQSRVIEDARYDKGQTFIYRPTKTCKILSFFFTSPSVLIYQSFKFTFNFIKFKFGL